jgi:hypothetical protein
MKLHLEGAVSVRHDAARGESLQTVGRPTHVRFVRPVLQWGRQRAMGNQLSAQDTRRFGRTVVCGALLVYGCLRIPAAAQPAAPRTQELPQLQLQQLQEDVRQLEAQQQQILGGLDELK